LACACGVVRDDEIQPFGRRLLQDRLVGQPRDGNTLDFGIRFTGHDPIDLVFRGVGRRLSG
jgi:hypothetical protein